MSAPTSDSPVAGAAGAGAGVADPSAAPPGAARRRAGLELLRFGVFGVFVLMIVLFGILRTDEFLQWSTARSILNDAAVLAVVASGLTVVLAIGEFDLSFGNVAGFAGAIAVYAMANSGAGWVLAVVVALLAGLAAGAVSGLLVAYGRVPALIGTLAVGSAAIGLERALMDDKTVYDGISTGFLDLTSSRLLGLPLAVWISIAVVIAFSLVMSFTVYGRRVYAVGGSEEAARIAGIRTRRIRVAAFMLVGLGAALAGVMLMSRSASYYPNAGTGLLLPAYAACFLGWSASSGGRFHPAFTYFGVLFMGVLTTGLVMLQVESWVTDLVQGLVLAAAVLVAASMRRGAR